MNKAFAGMLLGGCIFLAGCILTLPAKYEVTDVTTGKRFTTYQSWGEKNMLGYHFIDANTGERVVLKSYTVKKLSSGGIVDRTDPRVLEFQDDSRRSFGR